MITAIVTFFGVGFARPAPGTVGSFAALICAIPLFYMAPLPLFIIATCCIGGIGYWAVAAHTKNSSDHDPSFIVIDEVFGQWIALWPVHFYGVMQFTNFWYSALAISAAFLLFRLFDIVKIGPVGWFDRRNDAFGVMMDDGVAGLIAAIILTAAFMAAGL